MQFRTYADLSRIVNENIGRIENDFDLIVGIPRSGMLPAAMISLLKNIPLTDLDAFCCGRIYSPGKTKTKESWICSVEEAKKILVVEDSCMSGRSIASAREKSAGMKLNAEITYLAVFCTKESAAFVDMHFEICEQPRMFEWNYLHHSFLEKACFDIDGVLCRDPSEEENDDGKRYTDFCRNVSARVVPSKKIGCLVTSRLEKYRGLTTKWMEEHAVQYGRLIMMQYGTKLERQKKGNHGEFKGRIYKSLKDSCIFIESDPLQAEIINRISGKGVFCVGNQLYYPEKGFRMLREKAKHSKYGNVEQKLRKSALFRLAKAFCRLIFARDIDMWGGVQSENSADVLAFRMEAAA